MIIAVRRVDQTRETLNEPPAPVAPGEQATQLGPTSAGNLLTALSDLRNSQNNFMSVWLNHYAVRMVLMRDLGLMELDEQGLWIDRPLSEVLAETEHGADELPEVPSQWLESAGIDARQLLQAEPGTARGAANEAAEDGAARVLNR